MIKALSVGTREATRRSIDGSVSDAAGQRARQGRSGLDAHPPARPRISRGASRSSASFIYENILHHDTLETAVVHRVSQRLEHADVSSDLIRQAYPRSARRPAVARRGLPRRHRRHLRPRSGDHPLHRAGALLQGLPRHSDASPGALAARQGPQGFRAIPAEPLVGGVPVRHQSGAPRSAAASSSIMPPASWSARPR